MRILITGANGFVARNLIKGLCEHEVVAITRADVNLLHEEEVDAFFADKHFDVVIHTAISGGSRLNPLEGSQVLMDNLRMHYNLMKNEKQFDRFISFGSGAELTATTPYGLSKHFIRESMQLNSKCFNIRIFAVFGEDELDTRFIKSNIHRYLERTDMIIHQDKYMDFFYIDDLVSMVRWVISLRELPINEMECSYVESYTLTDITAIINKLSNYRVGIETDEAGLGSPYKGTHLPMPFPLIGLEAGIRKMYTHLKTI